MTNSRLRGAKRLKKYVNALNNNLKSKLLTMIEYQEVSPENLWEDLVRMKNKRYPNPTYVSAYRARHDFGLTDKVLAGLVSENMIRTDGNNPPKYALEDMQVAVKLRHHVADLETADIVGEHVVKGNKKYLVMDLTKWNKTVDKYRSEILDRMHKDLFGEVYDFIPKDLTLEEKIELIKQRHKN